MYYIEKKKSCYYHKVNDSIYPNFRPQFQKTFIISLRVHYLLKLKINIENGYETVTGCRAEIFQYNVDKERI